MIPSSIKENIMAPVLKANQQIYLVGGWVRNQIESPETIVYDLDFASSMSSQALFELFISMPGIKHYPHYAAVHFKYDVYDIEITQMRQEIAYHQRRYPIIETCDSLYEDALRRDFTINALYLDYDSQLIDYHGGLEDLQNKQLKVIGDAFEKMQADHLRTIRALRFMAQYGYHFDKELEENLILDHKLSKKQMAQEVKKLLEGPYLMQVHLLYPNYLEAIFGKAMPLDVLKVSRQALYRLLVLEQNDAQSLEAWLSALQVNKKTSKHILTLQKYLYEQTVDLKSIFIQDQTLFHDYMLLLRQMKPRDQAVLKYQKQIENNPSQLDTLRINGHDLIKAHVPTWQRAYLLRSVLWEVFWEDLENEKPVLMATVRRLQDELY